MPPADELAAAVRAIRDRVRARHPAGPAESGVATADLMPLVHGRDAAQGKVAAIGTVNPRPSGVLHSSVQVFKRLVARCLDWHVREQIEFNRHVVACVSATLEALNDVNRALVELSALRRDAEELKDIRSHWAEWSRGQEDRLFRAENQVFRSVAQTALERVNLVEQGLQQRLAAQERAAAQWRSTLDRGMAALAEEQRRAGEQRHAAWQSEWEGRFWDQMQKVRADFDRMVHTELRMIRQRSALATAEPASLPPEPAPPAYDTGMFSERFRGSEQDVREKQEFYVPWFAGCRRVLDIGCGRGEFLGLLRDAGVPAYGIDSSSESIAVCRSKSLEVEQCDLFAHLAALPESSLDGVFCAQVVEHLPPARLPEFVRLAASRLAHDGILVIETPDPRCLAIFATHFYLDPTHTRPVPSELLAFYLEENGIGGIRVERRAPAVESMPSLASLPDEFRAAFFGGLDYAIAGRRLS